MMRYVDLNILSPSKSEALVQGMDVLNHCGLCYIRNEPSNLNLHLCVANYDHFFHQSLAIEVQPGGLCQSKLGL